MNVNPLNIIVFTLLTFLAGNVGVRAQSEVSPSLTALRAKEARYSGTTAKLMQLVVPSLRFNETPFNEALNILVEECHKADRWGDGIEMVLTTRAAVRDVRITFHIQNIPAIEALKYITRLAEVEYTVRPDGLVLVDTKQKPKER